ncbi:hypothetical protein BJY01DRAFT_253878 [Aspergillus pseudoustus]|uniref:Extracellular membrane protein CFEM domain-containing protein n=1 Tax=Aspergillus pseudoustus TaxID=1810923 RepID=A0ABR4IX11_9EURO
MDAVGPGNCPNYTGSSPPSISNEYYCYIPLRQPFNTTQEPIDTLRGCCPDPDANIGLYGLHNCEAYCNATEDTVADLESCLLGSRQLQAFGCSTGGTGGPVHDERMRTWGVWVVVGLVITGVWGV